MCFLCMYVLIEIPSTRTFILSINNYVICFIVFALCEYPRTRILHSSNKLVLSMYCHQVLYLFVFDMSSAKECGNPYKFI